MTSSDIDKRPVIGGSSNPSMKQVDAFTRVAACWPSFHRSLLTPSSLNYKQDCLMPKPNKLSRKTAREDLENLYQIFGPRTAPHDWNFSSVFEQESCSEGTPMDFVRFNHETLRYESTDENVKPDDFIAQSMVMLILYRLEHGVGFWKACKQLSIVGDKQSSLQNLWLEEICKLIDKKRLGPTTLHHQDNFDGFRQCFIALERGASGNVDTPAPILPSYMSLRNKQQYNGHLT